LAAVQFGVVPEPSGSLSAVVVSGGKQYRVAPGDRILVDRLHAEPGVELTLDRVLLVADGSTTKVGLHELRGLSVQARVIGHRRGPKIDVIRYKPKKRVRVHRGARADLTALEILGIGDGKDSGPAEKPEKPAAEPAEES
jgi:large subunit ribosomal protein L21